MFRGGARPGSSLLYVALGAGMMGIWSSTLFGSGGLIQWQRWQGTLEYVIGVPTPPSSSCCADDDRDRVDRPLLGGFDAALGRLIFGVPLDLAHPVLVRNRAPGGSALLGLIGLVLASTFVF